MAAIEHIRRRALKALGLLWIVASVLAWLSMDRAAAAVSDGTVDALAGEIMRGLETADLTAVPALSGYTQPTIAIKAFTDDASPVGAATANYMNDRLLMALQRQARGRFRFVARDAVGDLIADIDATTEPSAERDARLRDLQANLRADILIRGLIRQTGGSTVLSYQAVASATGALFVSTTPVVISGPLQAQAPADYVHVVRDRPAAVAGPVPPSQHATVLEAERLLFDLGYEPGPVDGILTTETRTALRAYQRDSALPINGRMTWRVVENLRRDTR